MTEFGSVKTQEGFEDLYAMSPYAHVQDGVKYPAVMVTTSRRNSWTSRKCNRAVPPPELLGTEVFNDFKNVMIRHRSGSGRLDQSGIPSPITPLLEIQNTAPRVAC